MFFVVQTNDCQWLPSTFFGLKRIKLETVTVPIKNRHVGVFETLPNGHNIEHRHGWPPENFERDKPHGCPGRSPYFFSNMRFESVAIPVALLCVPATLALPSLLQLDELTRQLPSHKSVRLSIVPVSLAETSRS